MVKPHGRKGEVLAQPLRGLPSVLEPGMRVALTPPALKRDRFCTVVSVTDTGDGDLVSFEGIDDLTAAEGITGCYVLANRDDFELDSLDAAYTDLMGREVSTSASVRSARSSRSCRRPLTMFGLSRAIGTASNDPVIEQVVSIFPTQEQFPSMLWTA
ncbi:MAG: ribosome maturation factor RimM [Collinsella aerofaciens]